VNYFQRRYKEKHDLQLGLLLRTLLIAKVLNILLGHIEVAETKNGYCIKGVSTTTPILVSIVDERIVIYYQVYSLMYCPYAVSKEIIDMIKYVACMGHS
jgi:hypothetical protein